MRTIKFRAYHKARKEMYPVWSYATDFTFKNTMDGVGCDGVPDRTEELELMQFTGLTDKNGKEIYEGDVLKWKSSNPFSLDEIRMVSVSYTQAQFWCNGTGGKFGKFGVYLAELLANERCEVIGNIHENPNLLK